jgi:cellulose synthase (UDP-forming)
VLSTFDIGALAPLILAIAGPFAALVFLGPASPVARAVSSAICILCALRYGWWRWAWSMPEGQETWQQIIAWAFLVFETMTLIGTILVFLCLSRIRDRSADVDARGNSPLLRAPTDVFIATYNEDRDILERTIVGATNIEHPDMRVWVLDDGARPWVRDLATELGALYCFRVQGKHAKAGNVNHGLREALSRGRRPEFLLLLDADFVAARRILRRTLPLFEEADVGIVQTPQHFFNEDPIQAGLLCGSVWPDEQRFFFNHLLPSKDAWGNAFCCGTSAVFRVEALERCGGMPTATVTEDMLTSFRMREVGYRTVFLNEKLSLGLAPEGLKEYTVQRSRWCLGTLQQIRTRWCFAGRAKVGLMNRLSYFEGALFWVASFPFKIMIVSAPMIYWWTGTRVIDGTTEDMLLWLGPYFFSGLVSMSFLSGNTVFPIMTDVTQLLVAPTIIKTVAIALVKPWGHKFNVTTKGVSADTVTVQWEILAPYAFVAIATVIGMLLSLSSFSPLNGTPTYSMNVFWSIFNVAVLAITCATCVEPPKRRRDERFFITERATMTLRGQTPRDCGVLDMSLGGARLSWAVGWGSPEGFGELAVDNGAFRLPFSIVRLNRSGEVAVRFNLSDETRRALIRRLFAGAFDTGSQRVDVMRSLFGAVRKVFQ